VAAPSTTPSLSDSDIKSLRSNWAGETRMADVYETLAEVATNPRARKRLKVLAETVMAGTYLKSRALDRYLT